MTNSARAAQSENISPNGAPILHGTGLAAVHKKIQDAFIAARTDEAPHVESDSLDLPPDIKFIDESLIESAPDVELIEIEDVSLTTACDAAAEEASLQAVKLQPPQAVVSDYVAGAWVIEPIVEDPSTIIAEALRELGEDPQ